MHLFLFTALTKCGKGEVGIGGGEVSNRERVTTSCCQQLGGLEGGGN